jgi:hypothetical protein
MAETRCNENSEFSSLCEHNINKTLIFHDSQALLERRLYSEGLHGGNKYNVLK